MSYYERYQTAFLKRDVKQTAFKIRLAKEKSFYILNQDALLHFTRKLLSLAYNFKLHIRIVAVIVIVFTDCVFFINSIHSITNYGHFLIIY